MNDGTVLTQQIAMLMEYVGQIIQHLQRQKQDQADLMSSMESQTLQQTQQIAIIDYKGMLNNGTSAADDFLIYVSNNKNRMIKAQIKTSKAMIVKLDEQIKRDTDFMNDLRRIRVMQDSGMQQIEIWSLLMQLQ